MLDIRFRRWCAPRFRGIALLGACAAVLAGARGIAAEPPDSAAEALGEFARRRAAVASDPAAVQLDLADWALGQGLPFQANTVYRLVLDRDPLNARAYEGLLRAAEQLSLPRESTAWEDARAQLPPRFIEYETRRFIVFSDADPTWTRRQSARLERTFHQFQRFAHRLELRPLPLRHKLVCVLFRRREDYRRFAAAHDDVATSWVAGYYAPAHDRVVFYHSQANPSVVQAHEKLDEMRAELEVLEHEARRAQRQGRREWAETLRQHEQKYRAHVENESRRVETFVAQLGVATTVHETIHQLAFHTNVQSPRQQYPLWISEGLATSFETDATGGAFGPDHEYPPRREMFQEALRHGEFIDLAELVTWAGIPGQDDALVHVAYHECYALVTWMSRFRKRELRAFLELMLAEPIARPTPAAYRRHFEEAFGDVEALEAAWLRYERSRLEAAAR